MKGVGFMVGRLSGKGKLLTITVSDWKNWEVPALFASPYHNILIHAKMSRVQTENYMDVVVISDVPRSHS